MPSIVMYIDICNRLKTYFKPYKTNLKKFRVGANGDGGYVIADLPGYDALYSYGSEDQITFEKAFYEKYKKPCYVYDHTINGITDKPDYIHYFKEGVSDKKEDNLNTIDAHLERNGHLEKTNLLMQIDVEGAEWTSLPACKHLKNFSQIVVEFHLDGELSSYSKVIDDMYNHLKDDFVCIHVHGNNYPLVPWIDNNFPRVFEVTYVRRDLIDSIEPETESFPIKGLDFPNFKGRPDMHIDYYLDE
jgi:hypothetical protein